jgi:hypothetical protein
MASTSSIRIQYSDDVWTVHVRWKVLSEIIRARIQPVHKIRADACTDATSAQNKHYTSELYLAEHYRVV